MASSSHNVELEAAKFLHKLIQDSTDEPAKLATKLYVILQHMKSSGKEHSMPYQVISRAMETVINQNGLDIEALKSSRLPLTSSSQAGDSTGQYAGSSQAVGITRDSKAGSAGNEMIKTDSFASSRPPVGPNGAGHDMYQGSVSHRGGKPFDHESPSSLDSRSTNSQRDATSWDKQPSQKDDKKSSSKRKRADSSLPVESHVDSLQLYDAGNTAVHPRKGKLMNKVESPGSFSAKGLAAKVQGGLLGASSSFPVVESGFSSNSSFGSHGLVAKMHIERSAEAIAAGSSPSAELSSGRGAVNSEQWKHGYMKGPLGNASEKIVEDNLFSPIRGEEASSMFTTGKVVEHDGGIPHVLLNANKIVQGGGSNFTETNMLKSVAPRDTGKSPLSQTPSGMPFKEQHLKQLRAQCLVFLAFRNGLMPKKLHLEIALGNIFPKEGSSADAPHKEVNNHRGKEQSLDEPSIIPEVPVPFGRVSNARESEGNPSGSSSAGNVQEADLSKGAANLKMEDKTFLPSKRSVLAEEREHILASRRKLETEMQTRETLESPDFLPTSLQPDYLSGRGSAGSNREGDVENDLPQVRRANQTSSMTGMNNQMKPGLINWTGIGSNNDASRGLLSASSVLHESVPDRTNNVTSQSNSLGECNVQANQHTDSHLSTFPLRDHWKPISGVDSERQSLVPVKDVNLISKHVLLDDSKVSHIQKRIISDGCKAVSADETLKTGSLFSIVEGSMEQEEEAKLSATLPPSPKYTTSEKWIMDQQKRKLLLQQNWKLKQKKADHRIGACFNKLKDTVNSSEDISAKTKSVIELKKLQLLELQRRLRSGFLNDFFKPITADMDRLKSMKKHRHGRRIKQLEKFEQKMKEERQKRIRERQKEFFAEIEVHKERLEDGFKIKKERWKNFNKYVKEFHKRKERIHRERIDRIQREKINLLKINDVEGYLRMVQDAKSDRVNKLLKETEKYLQKLGSKLKEAKAISSQFEDMDDKAASVVQNNEAASENDDESDQAKHYLESNEKYYLMAHSIKESIAEQPTSLHGGKLREYQMNGLRWLVSLYNNHLNGILADEMGLGKTVQVIALICYLMETKNDRGPFLVVVPSSVLPGWESEINFWASGINKIVYAGPPEERRKLFKERIVQQKFNVLLTTYEYLMNKHDRPKLSKIHWHYVIIDEGHRIKNASCKLNADLKHYQSDHRLLLTGTPLQNNLEELWALLNFLLPNIFNSSEDFSQWFNKPFESNGDNSADEALLSEEENLLIINRLHQVLRPFVLRRLKHKVENQLPEKIERLVRCEASAYQKLLMKRVEDNLGALGNSKGRSVHNSVMELRNICNHPYLSQLHAEQVDSMMPKHYLPPVVRLCGKLEMLDRLLPKLKATDHRVLFFSTMTRLLDVMEEYLHWKQYRYLRLDGHTSGGDRGALIDKFNQPNSPFFIFLLSIRAGGVGVNLQAADTVIIFDTDWNPQVDLQAQARAHRIGQKKDVLVLRLETVQTVEEQVRAAAEHKLGVANQSITAGFFDNNTSAEDRREYLESLLRESKKEEAAPVLNDDGLNDLLARSESEIDVFESVDKQRREGEMETWKKLVLGPRTDGSEHVLSLPARLVTDDDLKIFVEAMKIFDVSRDGVMSSNVGVKRKGEYLGGLDTKHYGRGKRAREVRSYEEQWTEEEFEKLCQADSPDSPKSKDEMIETKSPIDTSISVVTMSNTEEPSELPPPPPSVELPPPQSKEVTPPSKRGRGRPKRAVPGISPSAAVLPSPGTVKLDMESPQGLAFSAPSASGPSTFPGSITAKCASETMQHVVVGIAPGSQSMSPLPSIAPGSQSTPPFSSVPIPVKGQSRMTQGGVELSRRRGKKQVPVSPAVPVSLVVQDSKFSEQSQNKYETSSIVHSGTIASVAPPSDTSTVEVSSGTVQHLAVGITPSSHPGPPLSSITSASQPMPDPSVPMQGRGRPKSQSGLEAPRRRGRKQALVSPAAPDGLAGHAEQSHDKSADSLGSQRAVVSSLSTAHFSDPFPGPTNVQGGETISNLNVGITQSFQSTPVAPGSHSTSACPSVPVQGKRRGQKTQSGVVAPRRRGRKQGPAAAAVPEGMAGQNPKSNELTQKNSGDSLGGKAIATRGNRQNDTQEVVNVIHEKACKVPSPDDSAGMKSRSTEQKDTLSLNKQPASSSWTTHDPAARSLGENSANLKVDEADAPLELKDEILTADLAVIQTCTGPAFRSLQTVDTCDGTPVAKNVLSDPGSSFKKVDESSGNVPPNIPVSDHSLVEGSCLTLHSETNSVMSTLETAPPGFDHPIHKNEDKSRERGDAKVKKLGDQVLDKASETKISESCWSKGGDAPDTSIPSQSFVEVIDNRILENKSYSLDTAPPGFNLPIHKTEDQSGEESDAKDQKVGDPVPLGFDLPIHKTEDQSGEEGGDAKIRKAGDPVLDKASQTKFGTHCGSEGGDASCGSEGGDAPCGSEGGDAPNILIPNQSFVEVTNDQPLENKLCLALSTLGTTHQQIHENDDQSGKQGEGNAQKAEDHVLLEEASQTNIDESCGSEGGVASNVPTSSHSLVEVTNDQSFEDKSCSGISISLETAPPCFDLPTHESDDQSGKQGDVKVQKVEDPVLLEDASQTKMVVSCGSEGGAATNVPASSHSLVELSNDQSFEYRSHSAISLDAAPPSFALPIRENEDQCGKPGDGIVQKVEDPVLLEAASQIKIVKSCGSEGGAAPNLPGHSLVEVINEDKSYSAIPKSLETTLPCFDLPIHENDDQSEKQGDGKVQKIVLLENVLQTKIDKSCGSEGGDATIPVSSHLLVEVMNDQNFEDRSYSAISGSLETAPPCFDLPIHENTDQSGEGGLKLLEVKHLAVEDLVSKPQVCESESEITVGSVEHVADSRQLIEENSITESILEKCTVPPGSRTSETCSKETICGLSPGIEGVGDAPCLPVSVPSLVEVTNNRCLEDITESTMSCLDSSAPSGSNLPTDKFESQLGDDGDAKTVDVSEPVLNIALVTEPIVSGTENRIATGPADNTVEEDGSVAEVTCSVVSGTENRIATGPADNTVEEDGSAAEVTCSVVVSGTENRIATGPADNTVDEDWSTAEVTCSVVVSGTENRIAAGPADNTVEEDGSVAEVNCVVVSGTENRIATGHADNTVEEDGSVAEVTCSVVSGTENRIATGAADNTVEEDGSTAEVTCSVVSGTENRIATDPADNTMEEDGSVAEVTCSVAPIGSLATCEESKGSDG